MQAKVEIIESKGPILVRISSDGYMGIYQNGSIPADVQSFNSYQRSVPGPRQVRGENDGNLKGYYWSGSSWVLDYQAISETCELPSPCGPYGLCRPEIGCSCLDNLLGRNWKLLSKARDWGSDVEGKKFVGLEGLGLNFHIRN